MHAHSLLSPTLVYIYIIVIYHYACSNLSDWEHYTCFRLIIFSLYLSDKCPNNDIYYICIYPIKSQLCSPIIMIII